jgi:hypothetical protein
MAVTRTRLTRFLVAIALVAVAAVGLRLSEETSEFEVVSGNLGEPVEIEDGVFTATQVRVGVATARLDEVRQRTDGMFVLVSVQTTATGQEKLTLANASLLSGPRSYGNFGVGGGASAEPGFTGFTDLLFEVDPAQVDDLTLEIGRRELLSGYSQRVRVHLGITPDNADQWRAAARDQILEAAPDRREAAQ